MFQLNMDTIMGPLVYSYRLMYLMVKIFYKTMYNSVGISRINQLLE